VLAEGIYFYLYLFMDIFSRKIVGWQVYDIESSELAGEVMRDICERENIVPDQVVRHSDNGSPMKGASMLATLQALGVASSFSRPAVSNDNPYSEATTSLTLGGRDTDLVDVRHTLKQIVCVKG